MKTKILLTVILSTVLISCAPVSISTPTETLVPTVTGTVTPIPPTRTATPEPSTTPIPTEAGPKEGDQRTVTENGHNYRYTYDAELGEWVRQVANFPLFDWPTFNSVPYKVVVTESAVGERSIVTMTNKDFLESDLPPGDTFNPPRITAAFMGQLHEFTGIEYPTLSLKLRGADGNAYPKLPIILSNGEEANVVLSPNTGIVLTIMSPEKLKELGGDRVSTGYVEGITYYAEVYGVDEKGNMLGRIAFDAPLSELNDEALRRALFIFPASMIEEKDQRGIGQSDFSITLAHNSRKPQTEDSVTEDLVIERIPIQP